MDEMRIRRRNFKELGILYPFGWLYVICPLLSAAVPDGLIWRARKLYHRQDIGYGKWDWRKKKTVSENFEETSTAI